MPLPFTEHIVLENDFVQLQPLSVEHYPHLLPIAMEKSLWQFTGASVETEQDFKRYFDAALAEKNAGVSYPFAIFNKQTNAYAGSTRYGNISLPNKRVEIGWTWYHPSVQGSGINKACKFLLLQYGFEVLELNRIELKTSLLNEKSQRAMLKIGAVKEGVLRKHMITEKGVVRDTVYFSFIKEEWTNIKNSIFKDFVKKE
jgi:RimJ/RimL family protein N-acetyltransferase